ncbi:hypothetical protein JST97_03565 [bacterium]|nr:hypothetical protein [bacterium]
MYCPACDKEFSPVHSRCPECKGWLRVSGPAAGAKVAINPMRPPSPSSLESATTQKVKPITANNLPMPSRPQPVEASKSSLPGPGLQTATEPVEAVSRGALGSGWEASSFSAPAPTTTPSTPSSPTGWGAPAPSASGPAAPSGWGAPASNWGTSIPEPPKATGWGSSAPGFGGASPSALDTGLGGGNGGFAPPAGGFVGGLSSGPSSGQLGGHAPALLGGGPPTGGGWLGDGGGGPGPSSYSPPAARSGGWLGDAGSGHGSEAPPPLSMPPLSAPEPSSHSGEALAMPDHTVAVDLGTPWEDEVPQNSSNQMIYVVLACLIVGLLAFSGYIYWQRKRLKEPIRPTLGTQETGGSREAGKENLRKAQAAFKAHRYEEAQSLAQTAYLLLGELKVASEEERKASKSFYRQATLRYGASLMEQAQAEGARKNVVQAVGLADQAAHMFANLPGTNTEQAQALALEGRIYLNSGDAVSAMSAYSKANALRPGAYRAEMQRAREMGAPIPDPVPQQQVAQPLPPEEQPKVDSTTSYPSGHRGGGYRSHHSDPVPVAQPVGPAPKPRPQNTYVPPKKDDRPSWRKRPSDVLPTY